MSRGLSSRTRKQENQVAYFYSLAEQGLSTQDASSDAQWLICQVWGCSHYLSLHWEEGERKTQQKAKRREFYFAL